MKTNQENGNVFNNYVNITRMDSSAIVPETFLPLYDQSPIREANKSSTNKADSGLTYYNINSAPRKRPRDSINELNNGFSIPQKTKLCATESPFLDSDIVLQIHQHQSEIDRFVSQHVSFLFLSSCLFPEKISGFLIFSFFWGYYRLRKYDWNWSNNETGKRDCWYRRSKKES